MTASKRQTHVITWLTLIVSLTTAYNVMDPTGKWNRQERRTIEDCMEGWMHPKYMRSPPPRTERQFAWFYSLGWANASSVDNEVESKVKTERPVAPHRSIRKEIRLMTEEERNRFYRAVEAMRTNHPDPDDPRTEYEIIASYHRHHRAPAAHIGAAFLPWHREYIWR